MTILYKVTDDDDRTALGCQWGAGLEHAARGLGQWRNASFGRFTWEKLEVTTK